MEILKKLYFHKKFPFFVGVTLINFGISIVLCDPLIFFIRQIFLTGFFCFSIFFEKELFQFSEDYRFINPALQRAYPLLKLEGPLLILSLPSFYILLNPSFEKSFLYSLSGFILIFTFIVLTLRMFAILTVPEVKPYFFPKKTDGRRSFSPWVSVAKFCFECAKYSGFAIGVTYGGPKLLYGASYRSPVANFLGYYATGLKSDDEVIYSMATKLVRKDPLLKSKIVESDGYTISEELLFKEVKNRALGSLYDHALKKD